MVTLIKRLDDQWYEGRCGNSQGIFPAAYVSTIREPDTPLPSPCATPVPTPSPSRMHTPLPGNQIDGFCFNRHINIIVTFKMTILKSN